MSRFVVRLVACIAIGVAALGAIEASALALTGVVSRKVHGSAGTFDLTVDSTQALGSAAVTVEPRTIGSGHVIVFIFDNAITATGAASSMDGFGPIGSVVAAITGPVNNEVSVTLTGIPDNKRITISLSQVNNTLDVSASMGFLVGDVDNTRAVDSTDISRVKTRSGQPAASTSFVFDLNTSGDVDASDISAVKARSGLTLPSANEVSLIISKFGTGAGTVSSTPMGINCGSTCAGNFTQNTSVQLTATPNPGSTFSSWTGDCSGATTNITVVPATSLSCIATFLATPMSASIAWDPVIAANLSGYRIYYGTAPGTYIQSAGNGLNVGNVTSYLVPGLNSATRYYFAVKAYDASGIESGYSNEVFKDIP